jgi:hypothetical protein
MLYFFGDANYNNRDKYLEHMKAIMTFDLKGLFIDIFDKGDNLLMEEFIDTFVSEWLDRLEAGETLEWKGIKLYVKKFQA